MKFCKNKDTEDNSKVEDFLDTTSIRDEIDNIEGQGNFRVDKLRTWQEVDIDQIRGLVEGDHLKKGQEKFDEILQKLMPQDPLSAEEIADKYPKFPEEFYEFLAQASQDKFKVLLEEEPHESQVKVEEGEFKVDFNT
ncbi:MAG: hypothetical protein ACR2ON_03315 [Paracoccaceae bacterium]